MVDCIFCKIASKEIPAKIIYEDDKVIAIKDINPQAPVHLVLIPKEHIETLNDVKDFSVYSDVFKAVSKMTMEQDLQESGYRVVTNCNKDAGQTVFHIHFHLLGGRLMHWPPG